MKKKLFSLVVLTVLSGCSIQLDKPTSNTDKLKACLDKKLSKIIDMDSNICYFYIHNSKNK